MLLQKDTDEHTTTVSVDQIIDGEYLRYARLFWQQPAEARRRFAVTKFESVLQRVWDHTLEGQPVLLVVVGSDLATMEAVSSYDRPLYGRVRLERVVLPLNLAEVADVLGLGAPEAVDAYLTAGVRPRGTE